MNWDLISRKIRKQRDPLFRQQVLRAYNYECAICGFNMRHDSTSVAPEAAHIKWNSTAARARFQTVRRVQSTIKPLIKV